jgi:hypothetical protein
MLRIALFTVALCACNKQHDTAEIDIHVEEDGSESDTGESDSTDGSELSTALARDHLEPEFNGRPWWSVASERYEECTTSGALSPL